MSWPTSPFHRTYSLRAPRIITLRKSISESNDQTLEKQCQKKKAYFRRQSSVRETSFQSSRIKREDEIPVEGTRFRISRPSTATQILEDQSERI
jgi:hypothetical protein